MALAGIGLGLAVAADVFNAGSGGAVSADIACAPAQRYCVAPEKQSGDVILPAATPYWHSRITRDSGGLLQFVAPDGARFRNPSSIAFDIAQRGRDFGLAAGCVPLPMSPHRQAGLEWVGRHARELHGAVVWPYDYDTQVNDALLKAGWVSAFAQSAIIGRLLMAYCATKDPKYLDLARRGGKALLLSVDAGGVRSQDDHFVWFQEIPLDDADAPFIVNAHLYSIFALLVLHRMAPGEGFGRAARAGMRSLDAALPVIDNGYWNRYDLRPRYIGIDFLVRTDGAQLRSIRLSVGDAESRIDVRGNVRQPAGNAIWGLDPHYRQVKFILPSLRRFVPSLLHEAGRLRITVKCCGGRVLAYALGMRPGRKEYYELRQTEDSSGWSNETFVFATGLRDYSWGQVAPEYIPFDASLMALIARMTGRDDYLVYAYRWQDFYRNWQHDQGVVASAPVLARRFSYSPSPQLAARLSQKFGDRLPGAVSESELRQEVGSMPGGSASMLETLALRPAD